MTHEDLISHLAQQLGWSSDRVSAFTDTLIAVLKAELTENQAVTIDDFGNFVVEKYPEYILRDGETNERYLMPPTLEVEFESEHLCFMPEDALNESVNTVFAPFEPVRINEGADFPGLQEVVEGEHEATLSVEEPKPVVTTPIVHVEPVLAEKDSNNLPPLQRKKKPKKPSTIWIPIAGGMAVALAVLFFFKGGEPIDEPETVATTIPVVEDTIKVILPQPATTPPPREVKKVRLEQGKTLRLLALDLFGSREFWVYIYLENQDQIPNPNQVPTGLELVIPHKEKYDIDVNNPSSISKAKEMGTKILRAS